MSLAALKQQARWEGSTPLPWHAPPRLCGEPIAGADAEQGSKA